VQARHQQLDQIRSLLPKIEQVATQARALLLPAAINITNGRVQMAVSHMTRRRQQLL
jgi:hypothetical protein